MIENEVGAMSPSGATVCSRTPPSGATANEPAPGASSPKSRGKKLIESLRMVASSGRCVYESMI